MISNWLMNGWTIARATLLRYRCGGVMLIVAGLSAGTGCTRGPADAAQSASLQLPVKGKTSLVLATVCSLTQAKLGTFGSQPDLTPFLDDVARTGYSLQWATTPSMDTFGAVVGICTGISPRFHEPASLHASWNGPLPDTALTLAEVFKAAGYATAAICPHPELTKTSGLAQGFDAYFDKGDFAGAQKVFGKQVNEKLLEWLQKSKPTTIFAQLVYTDCEEPYMSRSLLDPTREGKRRSGQPEFSDPYNMQVEYVDDQLGELVRDLAAAGYSDVVLVVVADHGRIKGASPQGTHRAMLSSETIMVPWIIAYPALNPAWTRSYEPGSTLDLFPTVTEMFGLTSASASGIEGISRVVHMRDQPLPKPRPLSVVWSGSDRPAVVFGGNWKLMVEPSAWRSPGTSDKENLILGLSPYDSKRCKLYRYARDMEDTRNVIAQHDGAAKTLYEGLDRWLRAENPEQSRVTAKDVEVLESDPEDAASQEPDGDNVMIEEGPEADE